MLQSRNIPVVFYNSSIIQTHAHTCIGHIAAYFGFADGFHWHVVEITCRILQVRFPSWYPTKADLRRMINISWFFVQLLSANNIVQFSWYIHEWHKCLNRPTGCHYVIYFFLICELSNVSISPQCFYRCSLINKQSYLQIIMLSTKTKAIDQEDLCILQKLADFVLENFDVSTSE